MSVNYWSDLTMLECTQTHTLVVCMWSVTWMTLSAGAKKCNKCGCSSSSRAIILRDIDGSAKKRVNCVFQLMNAMYAVANLNPWAPSIVNSVALQWIFGEAGKWSNEKWYQFVITIRDDPAVQDFFKCK